MRRLVIVAHPDDEAIWFSPVLEGADLILAAYPGHPRKESLTEARELVRREYPLPFEFLPLSASGAFRQSDWSSRALTHYGVELRDVCPADTRERYIANYDALLAALGPHVADSGEIYSHNPWGEYGHEEHIQVWAAVTSLAQEHGADLWVWDGFGNEVLEARGVLTRRSFYTPLPELETRAMEADMSLYRRLRQLYIAHGAWTRADDYEPEPRPRYLQAVRAGTRLL